MPDTVRRDKIRIDEELLRRLYGECKGWIQRVHEKLVEEEGIQVKYSTLTRMLRKLGISKTEEERCDRMPDKPGDEMQHDTSPYKVELSDKPFNVIASLIYLRYCKRRYLRFYRSFNRFKMKSFFHEALMFWGYAAKECIIDNTNLARLRGTGKNAVIVPEMETFSKQYGFDYICHEVGHSNRKAGEERSFYTVETNFFPGRTFENMEDLNRQAFKWATVRMYHRPMSKTGLIPAKAFEHERAYLIKLPPYILPPYLVHERLTDQYGYISFDGNFYWVPGSKRDDVRVLEYPGILKLYQKRKCLVEYQLPEDEGIKNKLFSPEGLPKPKYQPHNRKKPTQTEEKKLRAMDKAVDDYLKFALKEKGIQSHRFIRKLFCLHRQMSPSLFIKTTKRALRYQITCIDTIRKIALMYINQNDDQELPFAQVDENLHEREAYQEGFITDDPDFTEYDKMSEDDHG